MGRVRTKRERETERLPEHEDSLAGIQFPIRIEVKRVEHAPHLRARRKFPAQNHSCEQLRGRWAIHESEHETAVMHVCVDDRVARTSVCRLTSPQVFLSHPVQA